MSRSPSNRNDGGIGVNRSSTDDKPKAASIWAMSSSVCGANSTYESSRGRGREGALILAVQGLFPVQTVLLEKRQVIALIEDLDLDARVELAQSPDLAVLPGDELLVHRRDLDVEIEVRKVEVRRESLGDGAVFVPLDVEGTGFVLPVDLIEVEEPRVLTLAGVREIDAVARQSPGRPRTGLA